MSAAPSTLSALRSLLAARFPEKNRRPSGGVPTGVPAVDAALGGGLPAGRLTEIVSAAPSSGGQTVLAALLVATRAARQRVALVDAADGFAPDAVPADALRHLVWVRGRELEATLAAADVLVRDGNFAAVVLDLRGCDERALGKLPAATWHRLHRATEASAVAVLVQSTRALVPAVPCRLILGLAQPLGSRRAVRGELAARLDVTVARGHAEARDEGQEALAG